MQSSPNFLVSLLALIPFTISLVSSCTNPTATQSSEPETQKAAPAVLAVGEVRQLATEMKFVEGPVWIPTENKLIFSDIPNSKLMQWSEANGLEEFRDSENSNGNLLDLQGRLLTCQHSGRNVVRTEKDGSITVLVDRFEGKRLNSPNDIAVKSDGTLWFTDPSYGLGDTPGEIDGKWVYRFDPQTKDISVVQ